MELKIGEQWDEQLFIFVILVDLHSGCSPIIDKIGARLNLSNICSNYTIFSEKTKAMNKQLKQILKKYMQQSYAHEPVPGVRRGGNVVLEAGEGFQWRAGWGVLLRRR